MKITADTNLLVRIVTYDDSTQARRAARILDTAETVFVPLTCLCELAWVLDASYGLSRTQIATSIRAVMQRENVVSDSSVAATGLLMLESGADFADGVIAASGLAMGSETFVSFDRKAVARLQAVGIAAQHASSSI